MPDLQSESYELLDDLFPKGARSVFVPAVQLGYSLANDSLTQEIFDWEIGREMLGNLRALAVSWVLKKWIDENKIPGISYEICYNAGENCKHLQLLTGNAILTISQVRSPKALPEDAIFRKRLSQSNQLYFDFQNNTEIRTHIMKDAPSYFLLTHGYGSDVPKFVCIGMPDNLLNNWIVHVNLLRDESYKKITEIEEIKEDTLPKFKEYAKEVLGHGS